MAHSFIRRFISCFAISIIIALFMSQTACHAQFNERKEFSRAQKLFIEGKKLYDISNFSGAIEKWEESASIYRTVGKKQAVGAIHKFLGDAYRNLEDYQKAIECYEIVLKVADEGGDKSVKSSLLSSIGSSYLSLKDYQKVIYYCEKSISIAEEMGDKNSKWPCIKALAISYQNLSDYRKALGYYEQSVAIADETGDKRVKGFDLGSIGWCYVNLYDYPKAISYFERALAIAEGSVDNGSKRLWLGSLGTAYSNSGDHRKAIDYKKQALMIAQEFGSEKDKGAAFGSMGDAYRSAGDYRKAIGYYEKSLTIAEETGDKPGRIRLLGDLGIAYHNEGNYQKAIGCYKRAVEIADEIGDEKNKGIWIGRLGVAYHNSNDFWKALDCYDQALKIAERSGDKKEIGLWFERLAGVYLDIGEYKKATIHIEKALSIAEETGDKHGKRSALNTLAYEYFCLGDYHKAIGYYQQALAIVDEIGDKRSKIAALEFLGISYAYLGDYQQAILYGDQAIAISKELGIPFDRLESYLGGYYLGMGKDEEAFSIITRNNHPILLGLYYLTKMDFQKAKEQYDRAREKDEKSGDEKLIIARWIGLGSAYEGLKEYENAYRWYKKAIDYMENQRTALSPAEREHYFEGKVLGLPRIEAYEGAVRCAFNLGRMDEAFYWAENTRGRLLSELLSRRHAGKDSKIPSNLVQKEENLTNRIIINKKQQQAALSKDNQELLSQLEGENALLKQQMDDLIHELRKQYPQYAAIHYPQPVKLSQLLLKSGETVIEYEVTKPFTIGMVIRDGVVIHGFKVDKTRADIENLIRRFRNPFQEGHHMREFSLNLSRELADLLIKPALPYLRKGERLIIIPDEALSLLPFEALLLEAPWGLLKEEEATIARFGQQSGSGAMDRKEIVRGLRATNVNNQGRMMSPRVSTQIFFETASDRFQNESHKQLAEIAAALKSKDLKGVTIRIEGHTDSVGNPAYNMKLSNKRAQAVKHYLAKMGVRELNLKVTGKGDTEPIADNATETGRKRNRRVDFIRISDQTEAQSTSALMSGLVYFTDEHLISYYQSASVLSLQRGMHISRAKEHTFFGLGDPLFDINDQRSTKLRGVAIVAKKGKYSPNIIGNEQTKEAGYSFGRLENTAKEVKEVGRLFSDSKLLIGPDASKTNVMKEDLITRRYILFSTHGILGSEIPYIRQPALVLNLVGGEDEDGFLTATEIFNMSLNADIVGLSACNTGLGIQSAGEGVVGLSRAFMYAGTDSVMVSLWSVSDESTYKLMVRFFEELKQGKGKSSALREAKKFLRKNGYDNPFYWSPFILIGEAG